MTRQGFLDMESLGLPTIEKAGRRHFNRFPTSPLLRKSAEAILAQTAEAGGKTCRTGPFVTVSTCSGLAEAGRTLARRTGGICENMEGAAVAQVCTLHDVPFLELRGVSNLVEDRDLSRWDLAAGAQAAQRALLALLATWDASGEMK
jgi:futalosine hydrolase